jgi:hypothetical protein
VIGGTQNHPGPGFCNRCGIFTLNPDLCDPCLQPARPSRTHPRKCAGCGRWDCTVTNCVENRLLECETVLVARKRGRGRPRTEHTFEEYTRLQQVAHGGAA